MTAPSAPVAEASAPAGPRGFLGVVNRIPIRHVLRGILVLQIVLACALAFPDLDMDRILGREARISTEVVDPVSPGSQTRPYSPRILPRRADGNRRTDGVTLPRDVGALEFSRIEHPELGAALLLAGGIGQGDSDRFEAQLDTLPQEVRTVILQSPGGLVGEALRLGAILRAAGLNTAVIDDGACISACPLILFAGVERLVSPQAWIGMHQAYYPQTGLLQVPAAITSIQNLQGEVLQYTNEMGVDPMVHVHALSTPPEEAYFLIEEELLRYRVATASLAARE